MALTPVIIKGWLHQSPDTDPSNPPSFHFFEWESTSASLVPLQPYTIETQIDYDPGKAVRLAVAAIQAEQAEALEKYLKRKAELDEELNKFLALPASQTLSADSVGGADDNAPDAQPEGDFAPDETSFG